jgi:hypothetical protein
VLTGVSQRERESGGRVPACRLSLPCPCGCRTTCSERLAVYGLTEEAETWDLQALVVSRSGEEKLSKLLESVGFEVVKGYTGKEALALVSLHPKYLAFSNLMLPDMSAFELLEKFRLFPYSHNMPFLCYSRMS